LVHRRGEHLLVGVPVAAHVVLAVGDSEADWNVGRGWGPTARPPGGGAVPRLPLNEAEPVVVGGAGGELLQPHLDAPVVGGGRGEALPLHHQLVEVGVQGNLQPQRQVEGDASHVHHPGPEDDRVRSGVSGRHALRKALERLRITPDLLLVVAAGRKRRCGGHHGDGLQDGPAVETVHVSPPGTRPASALALTRVSAGKGDCTGIAAGCRIGSFMSSESAPQAFRPVPRTGVIFVTTEAQKRGFDPANPDWCNLGQGQPETGELPGAPPRVHAVAVDPADQEYAPVAGLWELREAVAAHYNRTYRRGAPPRSPGG